MAQEIVAHYRWTLLELMRSYRWHRRATARGGVRTVLLMVAFVVACAYAAQEYSLHGWSQATVIALALPGYLLIVFALIRFLVPWRIKQNFAKSANRDSEVEWNLNEDGARVRTAHGSAELTWKAFTKAVQTREGLLLYQQPQMYQWLAVEAFVNRADYEDTVELVRRHIAEFRQIGGG